jgi:PAS domain S-box-containing protein
MPSGIFNKVGRHLIATAIAGVAIMLVLTIFLTWGNLPWTAFLTGILMASVLAEFARASRSEWLLMRRTTQLAAMKKKLMLEIDTRNSLEEKIANEAHLLHWVSESLTKMIMQVDSSGNCIYHNRAFRKWLDLPENSINGQSVRKIIGSKAYTEIATAFQQSLNGKPLRYEHLQKMPWGELYRLSVEHFPIFDKAGKPIGFYFFADDITKRSDLPQNQSTEKKKDVANPDSSTDHKSNLDVLSAQPEDGINAGMDIITAIQKGEFLLFCQLISPLPVSSGKTAHFEILIRLKMQDSDMIPPGAFFPLAERNGLMPYLDRWVVEHVVKWAIIQQNRDNDSVFFINVAAATTGDPDFIPFLQRTLYEQDIPGNALCFEITEQELISNKVCVSNFINNIRQSGCQVALSGFGRNAESYDLINSLQVDFIKIDGGLILNMFNNPIELNKVTAIDRAAKKLGIKTVAEMVESDEVIVRLGEIGIDFAQGFGISRPNRLDGK